MITSVDNERVKDVVRLRRGRERRGSGLFIAEGVREVERAREAGLVIRETFVAPELLPQWTHPHTEVSARVLAKMAYRPEPEGVLAIVEAPQRTLPADATLLLVAVGIEKPGNLGAMARTADAAGADALIMADARSDPWNPNAIRASTGAVFTLPIVETTRDDIAKLPQRRVAAVVGGRTAYTDADLTQPTALIVGAEDTGLDEKWRAIADDEVAIPVKGNTADSLNASAAAAVLLYETLRQRG
ncbi:MAG TPA: RNA methyltransferase [Gaiellaceae bacterium]|nr:RNA methyltransferase [Gaiellaceae bacterium]